jgi:phage shock protein PspC (stress-responsive transcriptional regulator)
MNKVIIINLNGVAYQLEEGGFEALRDYLDNAARRLEGNPDKDEIIADIEQAIGDKFRALLGDHKTVVLTKEVAAVITEMGPVQDASADGGKAAADQPAGAAPAAGEAGAAGADRPPLRRLYRITDGAMLAGVCNGLSAYLNLDVSLVRVGFALLSLFWGAGLLVYVILAFILPEANTPAEKAAATGAAATAAEFIRRARAGYYEGMKSFGDRRAHREWRRRFKRDMREWKHGFRREMRENAAWGWQRHWAQHPPPPLAAFVAWPILSLLKFVIFLCLIFAVLSLTAYGSVWGIGLPAGMPFWIGVIILLAAYRFITWPIKVARRAWFYPRWPYGYHSAVSGLVSSFVWLLMAGILIWLADRHVPGFHDKLQAVPAEAQHLMDSVRAWWARV